MDEFDRLLEEGDAEDGEEDCGEVDGEEEDCGEEDGGEEALLC